MSTFSKLQSLARKPVNRDFLRNTSRLSVVRVVGLGCAFALQVLLARLLGDTVAYGEFAWGQSLLFLIGGVIALGVPTAAGRLVVAKSARGDEHGAARVVRRALLLMLLSATVSVLVATGLMFFWMDQPDAGFSKELAIIVVFLAPLIPLSMLYQKLFVARQWLVLAFAPMQILRPVLTAILALALWWAWGKTLSAQSAVVIVAVSVLLVTLPQMVLYGMRQRRRELTPATEVSNAGVSNESLWRSSLPVVAARVASLTIEYSNVLLLGILAGPAAAGAYFAAERLALLVAMPAPVAQAANQSRIAAAYATGNKAELQLITRQTAHGSLWPTLALALPLALLAQPLLAVFNPEFSTASPVLLLLILGIVVKVALGPNQMLLFMTGLAKWVPPIMIATAIVHVSLLFILLPTLGALGAAITAGISGALSGFALLLVIRRQLHLNPSALPGSVRL